jgi:predicted HD phosphohydrolase
MDLGTRADWQKIKEAHRPHRDALPSRILRMLRELESFEGGFAVNQLVHSLQAATRAERDGAETELVVAALCHDMGKVIVNENHGAVAAEILKPFVSDDTYNVVLHHQDFQGFYFFAHLDRDPDAREKHRGKSWFAKAERFCEWDQLSFDPAYDTFPLAHFEPLIHAVFGKRK